VPKFPFDLRNTRPPLEVVPNVAEGFAKNCHQACSERGLWFADTFRQPVFFGLCYHFFTMQFRQDFVQHPLIPFDNFT
jgi:hypothetical protein